MHNVTAKNLAAAVDTLPVPGGLKPKPAVGLPRHQSAQLPSVLALQQSWQLRVRTAVAAQRQMSAQ